MANLHTVNPPAAGRVEVSRAPRVGIEVGLYQCLIVSAHASRLGLLSESALAAGWEPVPCCDPAAGLAASGVVHPQLALVDLECAALPEYRSLLEKLATTSGLLLVVCGKEGDPQEEIFVRQIGAWLYLPGGMEGEQMSLLCTEARAISERARDKSKQSARLSGSGPGRSKQRRR
jgi:hypothetical protein